MRKSVLVALAIATTAGCGDGGTNGSVGAPGQGAREDAVTPEQARAIATLEADTGRSWNVLFSGADQLPMHLSVSRSARSARGAGADFARTRVDAEASTLAFVERNKALFKMRNPRTSLRLAKSEVDALGMTHARFGQMTHGIPVSGAEITAHYDAEGSITSLDSSVVAGVEDIDVQPSIDAKATLAILKSDALARQQGADEAKLEVKEPSLVVFARDGQKPRLAWKSVVRAVYGNDPHLWVTHIDAKTGDVLERYDNLQHVQGSGVGVLGDTKKLEVTQQGAGYVMTDTSRGVTIMTYTSAAREAAVGEGATVVKSNSATTWDATGVGKGAAVDAHVYAGVVYDHYKKVHGRNGLDGKGSPMLSSVHYGVQYQNSFWDGNSMSYGDGEGQGRAESCGLDVVGHEFTHGVTETTSALEYVGQSGALNESVSDIFAVFIEHGAKPDEVKNWILFEDVNNGFRDMKDPTKYDQPSNMSQFVNTQQDNGGVHINSGIPNNLMALTTVGGTNPASKVVVPFGLGWEKSEKLWFRAAFTYFQARTSFAQAGQALMQAAKDLSLTENEQNIIDCSLKAVGIAQGACKTIVDPTSKVPDPTPDPGTDPGTGRPSGPSKPGPSTGSGLPTGSGGDDEEESDPGADDKTSTQKQSGGGCNAGAGGSGNLGAMLFGALAVLAYRRKRR